jgi:catalase
MDRNFLQKEIVERLPARFTLVARIAQDGDPIDDPTIAWPDGEREEVEMGVLEVTGPETERERGEDIMVMDPMRVTDGIEPSDDPILHVRSHAYSVSVERRSGAPRPAEPIAG